MTDRLRKLVQLLAVIAIGVSSIPLSLIAVDSFFGLGSALVVPAFMVGVWFTFMTRDRQRRAWWFGFVVAVGLCLPLCSYIEHGLMSLALYLQHLTQQGTLSLSQPVIEPICIISVVLCPFFAACLLGILSGRFTRRLARGASGGETVNPSDGERWRFSVREMLAAFTAIGLLLGWIGGYARNWNAVELENQKRFLTQFKTSFVSGGVKLLAEPTLEEQQRSRTPESGYLHFRPPGINEYRMVAPIEKNRTQLWGIWAYTCNGDANDMIYKFAYAEALDQQQLPKFPFPPMRYIEGTWEMVDGDPATAGPTAIVISVTSPAAPDKPLALTASAPPGTICELSIFPQGVATPPPTPQTPDQKGIVKWSWNVPPNSAGWRLAYELRCIEKRGPAKMMNSTRGNIQIAAPQSPSE